MAETYQKNVWGTNGQVNSIVDAEGQDETRKTTEKIERSEAGTHQSQEYQGPGNQVPELNAVEENNSAQGLKSLYKGFYI